MTTAEGIGKRIRQVRKTQDLTQQKFAEFLGMKQNTIATYEMGRANPSDPTIKSICREFGINEEWLRTGMGEMFAPSPTSALDALALEQKLTYGEYILIEKMLHLKREVRQSILDYIVEVAAAINSDNIPIDYPAVPSPVTLGGKTEQELKDMVGKHFQLEKEAKEKSEVS